MLKIWTYNSFSNTLIRLKILNFVTFEVPPDPLRAGLDSLLEAGRSPPFSSWKKILAQLLASKVIDNILIDIKQEKEVILIQSLSRYLSTVHTYGYVCSKII